MSKGRVLALSALIVTLATFLGRIFGFAREMAIANKFGAGAETDAFLVAFGIPNTLYSLIVMGALSASFIPVFTGLLTNNREREAWRLASAVFNIVFVVFGLIMVALVVFAPQAIKLWAPGFKDAGQLALSANLLKLMAPALILLGISGLMAGILNSYNHFAAPSLVALVQNIVVVGCIIMLSDSLGFYGAAVGLLLGSFGQVLIQIPIFIKRKIRLQLLPVITHENLADVGKLFLPVLIALSASQSNVIIDKWIASFLAPGSISSLNFAYKVASLPVGTLIAAIAIVLFPTFSKQAAQNDTASLRDTISLGIRMVALVAIPASVGLLVLSTPITRLLFEHGAFTKEATAATAPVLAAYSLGLFTMGLSMLLVRAFYALKDGMAPLKAALVYVVVLIAADLLLTRLVGHVGLALGYVLAVSLMVAILLKVLHKKLGGLQGRKIARSVLKIAVAAFCMGVVTFIMSSLLHNLLGSSSKLAELTVVAASIIAGVIVYLLSLIALKAEEISLVKRVIASKLSKVSVQTA